MFLRVELSDPQMNQVHRDEDKYYGGGAACSPKPVMVAQVCKLSTCGPRQKDDPQVTFTASSKVARARE